MIGPAYFPEVISRDGDVLEPGVEDRFLFPTCWSSPYNAGPVENRGRAPGGVPENVSKALRGVRGIQRRVELSGLEDPEHGGDGRGVVSEQKGDGLLALAASFQDRVRDTVRGGVECRVREGMTPRSDRRAVRAAPDLRLEALHEGALDLAGRERDERAGRMDAPRPDRPLRGRQAGLGVAGAVGVAP